MSLVVLHSHTLVTDFIPNTTTTTTTRKIQRSKEKNTPVFAENNMWLMKLHRVLTNTFPSKDDLGSNNNLLIKLYLEMMRLKTSPRH